MPCPRPRVAVRGRFPHAYYPAAYKQWQKAFVKALGPVGFRFEAPVSLWVEFGVHRPRTSKLVVPKPDIDNYLKALLDGLTAAGVWKDDTQVSRVRASKLFVTGPGYIDLRLAECI